MVELLRPSDVAEAAALAGELGWDAKLISGGTALVLMMQQGLLAPQYLISLERLKSDPAWSSISTDGGVLRIGAGATLSAVAHSAVVQRAAPSLAAASQVVGNIRIRNVATLGGNVAEADYASDPPAVLVSLGAAIEVTDGTASRTIPAAEMFTDFYTTALEMRDVITAIRVPVVAPGTRTSYTKFQSRSAEDRPCVGVATSLRLRGEYIDAIEIVIGAVSGTPQRFQEITAGVIGRPIGAEAATEVAEGYAAAIDPLDDVRGSAWYRREVVRTLVQRSIEACALEGSDD